LEATATIIEGNGPRGFLYRAGIAAVWLLYARLPLLPSFLRKDRYVSR
jgi:hypothetical protein